MFKIRVVTTPFRAIWVRGGTAGDGEFSVGERLLVSDATSGNDLEFGRESDFGAATYKTSRVTLTDHTREDPCRHGNSQPLIDDRHNDVNWRYCLDCKADYQIDMGPDFA